MSDHVQISPVASSPAPTTPMHENARECTVSAEIAPHPAQLNNPCPERAQRVEGPTRALNQKHRTALDMLVSGKSDSEICLALKIDASTLYRWKHNNPLFIAALNRRHQELWSDIAANLRLAVARAIATIDRQLLSVDDVESHRAARTLLTLASTDRLSPKNAPTRVDDVLDAFLRNQQPKAATKPDDQAQDFSDAERQALLDQIFAEEDQAEADEQAAAAQRSALYYQRRAKSKTATASTQPQTPEKS